MASACKTPGWGVVSSLRDRRVGLVGGADGFGLPLRTLGARARLPGQQGGQTVFVGCNFVSGQRLLHQRWWRIRGLICAGRASGCAVHQNFQAALFVHIGKHGGVGNPFDKL